MLLKEKGVLSERSKDFVWCEMVGSGQFGEAFRGTARANGQDVIVKRLNPKHTKENAVIAEAAVLDRLRGHAHIVVLLDAFLAKGVYHLVFEDGGQSLQSLLDPLPSLAEIRSIASQCASALEHVHSLEIVHADFKPPNIVVDTTGGRWHCRLADFGSALAALDLCCRRCVCRNIVMTTQNNRRLGSTTRYVGL
jgi:serine/threonine protein kinase